MCKQLTQLKSWLLYMLEISKTPFQVSLFWINAYEINAASSLAERTESKILIKLFYLKRASREEIELHSHECLVTPYT